jgi:FtsH-binding integral membrane protein
MATSNRWENVFPATFAGAGIDLAALLKANNLSTRVQNHLKQVYATLALTMLSSVLGVVFYLYTHLSPFLSTIGMMVLLFGLTFENRTVPPESRIPRLLLFGFFQGTSVGSLVEVALNVSPLVVVQAFLATVAVFVSFAAVATLSERRSMLYLYGIVSSGLSWLFLASMVNLFVGSAALFSAELYLGLALFVGYVCADSQMIIERADAGDDDYVRHALELFLDFVAIFVRILVIFMRSKIDARETESRKKRRDT